MCYRALAQEAEDLRFRLAYYVNGICPRQLIAAPTDLDLFESVRHSLAAISHVPLEQSAQRLSLLLQDMAWIKGAYVGIRGIKRENWRALFAYAPILISSAETAKALNQFASLNESLIRLERLFEELAQADWANYPRPSWQSEVVRQWFSVQRLAVELENDLHRGATQFEWVSDEALEKLLAKYGLVEEVVDSAAAEAKQRLTEVETPNSIPAEQEPIAGDNAI